MKKYSATCLVLSMFLSGAVTADDITWQNVPASGSSDESYDSTPEESDYKYESVTGTKYKYDLNNPVDKIKYDTDPAAQVMDEVDPMVEIDRDLGQHGGGAEQ